MAKQEEKPIHKGALMCRDCNTEFVGNECPECGNKKNNTRLASDGIDQGLHTEKSIFGGEMNFVTADDAAIGLMQSKQSAERIREFNENMQETYVYKSEIKKKEKEIELMKREAQLREQKLLLESGQSILNRNTPQNQNVHQDQSGAINPFSMGMNPQTAFMSQLMKMDKDKRSDFLTQLSEADPQALSVLGSMMAPAQQFGPQINPMVRPGYLPGIDPYATPYMQQMQMAMMQQQNQQQQHQPARESPEDSITTALTLVGAIQDMMSKNTPKSDDSMKELIREMREEQKELRRKLEERPNNSVADNTLRPIIDELANLKHMVIDNVKRPGLSDTLNEINTLVDGLERSGLVSRSGSGERSVDDQIKMKKIEHEISKDEKQLALEQEKLQAEKARLNIGQAMMASLMNRSFKKNAAAGEVSKVEPVNTRNVITQRVKVAPEVREEIKTDGGSVAEIRSASVKGQVI